MKKLINKKNRCVDCKHFTTQYIYLPIELPKPSYGCPSLYKKHTMRKCNSSKAQVGEIKQIRKYDWSESDPIEEIRTELQHKKCKHFRPRKDTIGESKLNLMEELNFV